jgi:hypothetical protein
MLSTINTLFGIRTSSAVNRFIYYAAKLPLIGRRIPDKAYANPELKRALAVLVWIAMVLWGFIGKFAGRSASGWRSSGDWR